MKFSKFTPRLRKFRTAGTLLFPLLILGVFLAGWWIGHPGKEPMDATATASGDSDTIWTCSMHPTVRQPDFGLCPICEMDLIPASAGGVGGLRELALSPSEVTRMGLRIAPVVRGPFSKSLQLLGKITPAETSLTRTTARVDGRLDKLYIDYTGATVLQGQPLAEIYSPALFVAQEELISARRGSERSNDRTRRALYDAAREKLRLLEISSEQIDDIARQEKATDRIELRAPLDGVVTNLAKREGDYVKTGDVLFTLADLSKLWVQLEAYEEDLPWLSVGQLVTLTTPSLPGEIFQGRIEFIDPILMEMRRIVQVRVVLDNPERLLKPGMFATARIEAGRNEIAAEEPLLVPTSAVLRTGDRALVYRRVTAKESENIHFEGREIVLGPRGDNYFVVHSGLNEGDLVATRGAFKLDSELQIQARPAMMLEGQGISEEPGLTAPETILGAWQPILRSLARAKEQMEAPQETGLQEKFEASLLRARQILISINPDYLADDYRPRWEESKMQLANLFTQVRLASQDASPKEGWQLLTEGLASKSAIAGLPWQLPDLKSLPPARLEQLERAIDAYLPIANSLAHDQPEQALAQVSPLLSALRPLGNEAEMAASELSTASDEATLRAALEKVTDLLVANIKDGAADQLDTLYRVHCPMAFNSKGADWLSRIPKVENPYFGSSMFDCGDVVETLSLPLDEPVSTPETFEKP